MTLLQYPLVEYVIKIIGSGYFLFLAYRMIKLKPTEQKDKMTPKDTTSYSEIRTDQLPTNDATRHKNMTRYSKPLGIFGAMVFQIVNIKAWFFAVSASGVVPNRTITSVIISQVIILMVTIGSATTWTISGALIAKLFDNPRVYRIIGALLAFSLIYISIRMWV